MTPSRLRRLQADHEAVRTAFANHPYIRLVATEGDPPEKYTFEFKLTGLTQTPNGTVIRAANHQAEVALMLEYPRRPPFCRMLTPVFHPNIDPQKICIGDHWTAGQSIADMILRIAEMICFQSYNLKSPLNATAAAWASENAARLPLHKGDISGGA